MNNQNTITIEARIDKLFNDTDRNLRAIASINVCGVVAIHEIKVMDSDNGILIAMPSYSFNNKKGEKRYKEYAHPITREARKAIHSEVLKAYNNALLKQRGITTNDEE